MRQWLADASCYCTSGDKGKGKYKLGCAVDPRTLGLIFRTLMFAHSVGKHSSRVCGLFFLGGIRKGGKF